MHPSRGNHLEEKKKNKATLCEKCIEPCTLDSGAGGASPHAKEFFFFSFENGQGGGIISQRRRQVHVKQTNLLTHARSTLDVLLGLLLSPCLSVCLSGVCLSMRVHVRAYAYARTFLAFLSFLFFPVRLLSGLVFTSR